jgi:hypothetical protein
MYGRGGRGRETRGEGTEKVGTQEEAVGEGEGDGGSSCVGLSSSFHRELRLGKQEGWGLFFFSSLEKLTMWVLKAIPRMANGVKDLALVQEVALAASLGYCLLANGVAPIMIYHATT